MSEKTVLIIEDNFLNLKLARELLQMAGFAVLEAGDTESGIQVAKACRPDIILMDLYFQHATGYEAAAKLKSGTETRDIPIVAFTASIVEAEIEKAREAGFSGFIGKPINVQDFAHTVSCYLMETSKVAVLS